MHIPVLLNEVIFYLDPHQGDSFIDATVGWAGHSLALLEKVGDQGKILGINWDKEELKALKTKIKIPENFVLKSGNFAEIKEIAEKAGFNRVQGIIFDLGLSSWQIDKSCRGFSFQKDENLDMRFSGEENITASNIINRYSYLELINVFQVLGEEKYAARIAKEIVRLRKIRPFQRTLELVAVIKAVKPKEFRDRTIHPATKIFQALRIETNQELSNLRNGLSGALKLLERKGRIGVISFHSLEDRIVKNIFRSWKFEKIGLQITKKPIIPSPAEIKRNPRSRSAKLRIFKLI